MKFARLALMALPIAFWACGDSSSDSLSASGDGSYGEKRYERKGKNSESTGVCRIYTSGTSVTLVYKQDFEKYGSITALSQVDVGNRVAVRDEVSASDLVFVETIDGQCEQIKKKYDEFGGKVTCTATEVKASGVTGSVTPARAAAAFDETLSMMAEYCDVYIDELDGRGPSSEARDTVYTSDQEEYPIEDPFEGKTPGQAISCDVKHIENTALMEVVFTDRSFLFSAVFQEDGIEVRESYTGVDPQTIARVCNEYKASREEFDYVCTDDMILYKSSDLFNIEDLIEAMEVYLCPAFMDGMTLEDYWFEE